MVVEETVTTAASRDLLLVLPGLGQARRCAGSMLPRLPAFEQFVARGDRGASEDAPSVVMLSRALPQLAGTEQLAAGPLSRLADTGRRDDAWWARADPVHLAPVRDHLRLFAVEPLSMSEAGALAASCSDALAAHGLALEAPNPDRWYVRAARALQFTVGDPARSTGRDVYDLLPDGPDGAFARRVLTELQMVMHDHPVNRARERAGTPAVNSLWLWGGGMLPAAAPAYALPGLRSDDPVLRGLWRYAGAASDALPAQLVQVTPGVILTRLCEAAALDADPAGCSALLERIEAQWLRPMLDALRAGSIERVHAMFGSTGVYALDRHGLRRWWRRPRALE
jgi:hypothetical protein